MTLDRSLVVSGKQSVDVRLSIAVTTNQLGAQLVDAGEELTALVGPGLLELVQRVGVPNELVVSERRQVVVTGAVHQTVEQLGEGVVAEIRGRARRSRCPTREVRGQDRRQLVGKALVPSRNPTALLGLHQVQPCLCQTANVRDRVIVVLQLCPQGTKLDQRQLPGIHNLDHQHPPLTGGRTATSSPAPTGSAGSAASPLTHTLHDGSTCAKPSPNEATAAASTSPTVVPENSARPVPAASRADANIRSVAIAASVPAIPSAERERLTASARAQA